MGRKKAHAPEEIVAKLRQAEVLVGERKTVADAVRAIGVTEPTDYRCRAEFGGLMLDHLKWLDVRLDRTSSNHAAPGS
jgi:hypothetical protein